MDIETVKALMRSSQNSAEWNSNCDTVKAACGGYPEFWYAEVMRSGLMAEVQQSWAPLQLRDVLDTRSDTRIMNVLGTIGTFAPGAIESILPPSPPYYAQDPDERNRQLQRAADKRLRKQQRRAHA